MRTFEHSVSLITNTLRSKQKPVELCSGGKNNFKFPQHRYFVGKKYSERARLMFLLPL